VNADERPHSLADQAAAWVPPWERAPAPRDAGVPDPVTVEPGSVEVPPVEVEPGPVEPEPVAVEPEPVAIDPDPGPDIPEPDPGPEPIPEPLPEPEPPKESIVDPVRVRGALEAILLVVDEPVTEVVLAQVLEQPADTVAQALAGLAEEYTATGRGFELRKIAGGWRLYTRGDFAPYVEKFVLDGQQVRLTQAALETLAVVAYKQPVTRSRISAIRGVNSDGVIRTLVSRGLVEECGSEPETGAHLYRTTILFLEKLGLDSVEQLPPLAPFLPDDVDEIADAPSR